MISGPREEWFFRGALLLAAAFTILQTVSLPLMVTWDGFDYLNLADVIGSDRFPAEWLRLRTPLYPLALKGAAFLVGREPDAPLLVGALCGLLTISAAAFALRQLVGAGVAGVGALVLALDPISISYQHLVLTESGTAAFLAILVLLLGRPVPENRTWRRALALAVVCAAAYYWRQSVLPLAPLLGVLHWLGLPRSQRWRLGAFDVAIIVLIPFLAAAAWRLTPGRSNAWMSSTPMESLWSFSLLRQALLPPDHPYMAHQAEAYREAIAKSGAGGNFYSGLDFMKQRELRKTWAMPRTESRAALFFKLMAQHPKRYLAGVGRTMMLFSGAHALEMENVVYRDALLSTNPRREPLNGPPEPTLWHLWEEYGTKVSHDSVARRILAAIGGFYAILGIAAFWLTAAAVPIALVRRSLPLLALSSIPFGYLLLFALPHMAIDRYAFPSRPLLLANAVALIALTGRWALKQARRRRAPAGE